MCAAAAQAGADPVALLALIKAESGLNPKAERWGLHTGVAKAAIEALDFNSLQAIITQAWPDISFGYSQRIVLYHDVGDTTATTKNCLAVRNHVFENPIEDMRAAAARLVAGKARSNDNSWLGGMVVYNAGSDRRNDPQWMARFAGNVASYQTALKWAETFRL